MLVAGDEGRRRTPRAGVPDERRAASERDEEVARADAAGVDLDARDVRGIAFQRAQLERAELV
jgi:hypothetical protein